MQCREFDVIEEDTGTFERGNRVTIRKPETATMKMGNFGREACALVSTMVITILLPAAAGAQTYPGVSLDCYQAMAAARDNAAIACRRAADNGDVHAMFLLASRERNPEARLGLLRQAAEKGHPRAAAILAQTLRRQGRNKDAGELEAKAARAGFGPSRLRVAQVLRADRENAANVMRARQMMLALASEGYPEAQYFVAHMLNRGEGGAANAEQASRWLLEAASAGHRQAQFEYGVSLVETNPNQARRWPVKAARAGHAGAMYQLARLLSNPG
ncbi:MAG: sel1 repeat family protein, partial [Proteobacteria bacterium]